MDPALKPTGDKPGAHWMSTKAELLLPTFKRESRSSPALHDHVEAPTQVRGPSVAGF